MSRGTEPRSSSNMMDQPFTTVQNLNDNIAEFETKDKPVGGTPTPCVMRGGQR